jgi:hypothetical protein
MDALAAPRSRVVVTEGPHLGEGRRALEERARAVPRATCAHALDHFYKLGSDPAETLELARDNVRVRPNGAARVLLARELLAAGDAADARAEVDAIFLTPYRSADLADLDATLAP